MSVNRTVASIRSGAAGSRTPVRNSWISSRMSSPSMKGRWSSPGELHVTGALDVAGEPARVLDGADLVADAMDDQRGSCDRRDDVANVDLERHAHEGDGVVRCRRLHLEASELLAKLWVALSAGREVSAPRPLPQRETTLSMSIALLELLARRLAPRPVVRRLLLHLCAAEHERPRPLGIGRREEDRHRPALGDAHQRRASPSRPRPGSRARRPSAPRACRRGRGRTAPCRACRTG